MAAASPYLRQEPASNHLWVLAAFGLVAFAGALGVALAYGEMGAFYVGLSLVASMAVLFDFRIGVVLLVVMLPMGWTNLFPKALLGVGGLNPLNVLILATLFSYLVRGGRLRELAPKPLLWLFIVPILIGGLLGMPHVDRIPERFFDEDGLAFTNALGYFREFTVRPLLIVAIAMLLAVAAARAQKPERLLVPMMLAVWVMALIEIIFILGSGVRVGALAHATARDFFNELGLHANDLGRLFAVAYGVLLFAWWETKDARLKAALFFTLGIACIALALTFSRGAFLGFFIINGLFLLWKFNARTMGLALLAGALAAVVAPQSLWNRLTMGFDSGDANTVSADRIDGIWLPLLPEVWKTPPWGNGILSTMWSDPMLTGTMLPTGHPHNAYLEALLDMGVIGLVLLLAFYWHVWRGFRALGSNAFISPEMRGLFQGGSAALICVLVTGLVGSSLRPEVEFCFLWLAIGMMYGMLARKPGG